MRSRDCPYLVIKMVWACIDDTSKMLFNCSSAKGTITLLSVVIVKSNSAPNSDYALPT